MNALNLNKLSKEQKQQAININIYQSKYQMYKGCPMYKSISVNPRVSVNIGAPDKIPRVYIINNHPIDVAEEIVSKGKDMDKGNFPAILHVVGREFEGTGFEMCEGLRDHTYNLRTNFNHTVTQNNNPFPIKETECVYAQYVTVIRSKRMQLLPPDNLFRFSLISAAPIHRPEQIEPDRMTAENLIRTAAMIECVFKAAILGGNNILILTSFGDSVSNGTSDGVPTGDVIRLYNMFILRYGHMFSSIIIAIPFWDRELFSVYAKNILVPQKELQKVTQKINHYGVSSQ